jgi:hypothetical protein
VLPSRQQIPSAVSAFVEFATERLRSMSAGDGRVPADERAHEVMG